MSADVRLMETADVDGVIDHLFVTLAQRRAETGTPEPGMKLDQLHRQRAADRTRYQLGTDPDGCWVADNGGRSIVGHAIAIRREHLWGLAMLFVTPGVQSKGLGRRLLAAALGYGREAEAGIITSSTDPRAIRLYASSGFVLRPSMEASGKLHRAALRPASDIREGSRDDLALTIEVDQTIRGVAHGEGGADIAEILEHGGGLLGVVESSAGSGYVVVREGTVLLLAATTPQSAQHLLWWALGTAPKDANVEIGSLTSGQQWAIEVAVAAGLTLTPAGPILTRGRLGPLTPYLPSGHYL